MTCAALILVRVLDVRKNDSTLLVAAVSAERPVGNMNLKPLYCGGLCDAVIITPPAKPRERVAHAIAGVGQSRLDRNAGTPFSARVCAVACANSLDKNRVS